MCVMGCRLNELALVSWRALHPTLRAPSARGDLPSDKGRLGKTTLSLARKKRLLFADDCEAVGYADHHGFDASVLCDEVVELAERLGVGVLFRFVDDCAVP